MDKGSQNTLSVRVIYIVLKDAEPWEEASWRAAECLEEIQRFFADEMERLGHGRKTFEIARDGEGKLIFNHTKNALTKEEFGRRRVNNCLKAAQTKGLQSKNNNDIILYFYETFDGKVDTQGTRGSGKEKGAFLGSLYLKRAKREWLASNNKYDGDVIDWRGKKLRDLSGSAIGAIAHELGHAFGLGDNLKPEDKNFKINLMGSGYRRMLGNFRPDITTKRCSLSNENAIHLDKSNIFAEEKNRT